ncbi:MAG: SDR family NAD(P)-dependent oxidoreductase, partial [Burkholderiaceae bacterium]|nr:SDR family NAD(P)-dependent oxidoreductase [Burkholderiaceae bacterium]
VLQTNLLAPMLLTQALLPHLRRQLKAQVICVGSALGRIGLPGYSVYCASKFGLRGFAEALRRELGNSSVRVQYLGPRSTRTPFNTPAVEHYNQATGSASDTPDVVAAALLSMLEDESAERFLGFPEKLAVRLNGCAPGLLDGAFDKHRLSLPPQSGTESHPLTDDSLSRTAP